MNRYLKLVHYEFTRFRMIYASLFVLTLISQFGGLFFHAHNTIQRIRDAMARESLSEQAYVLKFGTVGFIDYTMNNIFFLAPIILCMAALLLYVFLIWYRDWLGKNMFIYRLMMLPTSKTHIYLAKLSVILMMILGLIAFQMMVLPLQNGLYNELVPSTLRLTIPTFDVIFNHDILQIIIPQSFSFLIIYFALGILGIIILFTAIIIERSYRWKGLIAGIAYVAVACLVFFLPMIISEIWFTDFLYPMELLLIEVVTGILVLCSSLWLSFYLMNNKISV